MRGRAVAILGDRDVKADKTADAHLHVGAVVLVAMEPVRREDEADRDLRRIAVDIIHVHDVEAADHQADGDLQIVAGGGDRIDGGIVAARNPVEPDQERIGLAGDEAVALAAILEVGREQGGNRDAVHVAVAAAAPLPIVGADDADADALHLAVAVAAVHVVGAPQQRPGFAVHRAGAVARVVEHVERDGDARTGLGVHVAVAAVAPEPGRRQAEHAPRQPVHVAVAGAARHLGDGPADDRAGCPAHQARAVVAREARARRAGERKRPAADLAVAGGGAEARPRPADDRPRAPGHLAVGIAAEGERVGPEDAPVVMVRVAAAFGPAGLSAGPKIGTPS